ncbi:MAG: hypothetical protein IIU42_06210, partial [Ruminococcus sp.]|nr:hypothetical protein [Ruminococcus sp.]
CNKHYLVSRLVNLYHISARKSAAYTKNSKQNTFAGALQGRAGKPLAARQGFSKKALKNICYA